MNVVMKIVLTLVMMLAWGIGKEVAQKIQGSGFGFMTLIVSLVCTWVIYDIWFGSFIFSKKNEESDSPVQNNTVNEGYLKTINNISYSMPEKQVDMPVQIHTQDSVNQSETIMNDNEYSEVINEDELYLQATQEVDEGNQDKALWAKCMALCEGDEGKAKYKYIKERVDRLRDMKVKEMKEENYRIKEIERAKVIEQQKKLEEEKIREQEFKRAQAIIEQQRLEEEIQKRQEIKLTKAIDKQKKLEEENLLKKILNQNNYNFYKNKYGPYVVKQKGVDKAQIFATDEEFRNFVEKLITK